METGFPYFSTLTSPLLLCILAASVIFLALFYFTQKFFKLYSTVNSRVSKNHFLAILRHYGFLRYWRCFKLYPSRNSFRSFQTLLLYCLGITHIFLAIFVSDLRVELDSGVQDPLFSIFILVGAGYTGDPRFCFNLHSPVVPESSLQSPCFLAMLSFQSILFKTTHNAGYGVVFKLYSSVTTYGTEQQSHYLEQVLAL